MYVGFRVLPGVWLGTQIRARWIVVIALLWATVLLVAFTFLMALSLAPTPKPAITHWQSYNGSPLLNPNTTGLNPNSIGR